MPAARTRRPAIAAALAAAPPERLRPFRELVLARGRELYRDLPWRRTRDPYAIWISEVMLQQTQVSRVDGRWQRWLARFPSVDALAAAAPADVLAEWQGLGYNRRALALHRAAQALAEAGGELPREADALVALPGVGPATAAGILAFAHDLPSVYLETNVRAVYLHELYPQAERVPDAELLPLVAAGCPPDASDPADDPRTWYFALLDYGAQLKHSVPNPSRRSAGHARQSRFEGSHRQKRAELLRILLAIAPAEPVPAGTPSVSDAAGATFDELVAALAEVERAAGRSPVPAADVDALLAELAAEGFCREPSPGRWTV